MWLDWVNVFRFFGCMSVGAPSVQEAQNYIRIVRGRAARFCRGESGWCSDMTSTHGAWRHAGVRFLLFGAFLFISLLMCLYAFSFCFFLWGHDLELVYSVSKNCAIDSSIYGTWFQVLHACPNKTNIANQHFSKISQMYSYRTSIQKTNNCKTNLLKTCDQPKAWIVKSKYHTVAHKYIDSFHIRTRKSILPYIKANTYESYLICLEASTTSWG